MERPALQRLLADIRAGKVDIVVVYKVDRLTRSLADFAKIVEIFDAKGVSFVSVTQQFNTTTSMGRLTLNVLLSFAQFEREVTGERIRDKIAASKKKGMWMGGVPPLGYAVRDRKLIIIEREAETVRHIFRRYVELGSVRVLKERHPRYPDPAYRGAQQCSRNRSTCSARCRGAQRASEFAGEYPGHARRAHPSPLRPAWLRRAGKEIRMVVDGTDPFASPQNPDPVLIKAILRTYRLHIRLAQGTAARFAELTQGEAMDRTYFARLLRLAYLAPDSTEAILEGR